MPQNRGACALGHVPLRSTLSRPPLLFSLEVEISEESRKGYVHVRRVGSRKHLVIWADAEERERLSRLRDDFRLGRTNCCPAELTRLKARPEQKRGRRVKASHDEINERPSQ
jgi:hypothetical protein